MLSLRRLQCIPAFSQRLGAANPHPQPSLDVCLAVSVHPSPPARRPCRQLPCVTASFSLQPSERTKTAEELAAEEQQRLERLESQRVKRMRGASGDALGDSSASEEDVAAPAGGFAGRRAKRRKMAAEGMLRLPACTLLSCWACGDCQR